MNTRSCFSLAANLQIRETKPINNKKTMKNQIEIVKKIADSMEGIGGIPNNEEFYAKFDMRVREALGIERSKRFRCAKCKGYGGVITSKGWNKFNP